MSDNKDERWEKSRLQFNPGSKRKRIDFVPASGPAQTTLDTPQSTSFGDRYLAMVFKDGDPTGHRASEAGNKSEISAQQAPGGHTLCEICRLPVDAIENVPSTRATPHEASMAHIVCLKHSHPPSHLDRNRQGLKYLCSYGWDPDSRLGLGASGEGIRAPIKAKAKHDTVGLGVRSDEAKLVQHKKVEKLNAKQIRAKELEDRKERERLHEMFYRNNDVEKYLGAG